MMMRDAENAARPPVILAVTIRDEATGVEAASVWRGPDEETVRRVVQKQARRGSWSYCLVTPRMVREIVAARYASGGLSGADLPSCGAASAREIVAICEAAEAAGVDALADAWRGLVEDGLLVEVRA